MGTRQERLSGMLAGALVFSFLNSLVDNIFLGVWWIFLDYAY